MQLKKLVEFQKRQAKGKRKGRKSGGLENDMNGSGPGGKKSKKRSHFDEELTNVKNARAMRHQPKSFKPGKGDSGPPPNKSTAKSFFKDRKSDKFASPKDGKSGKFKGGVGKGFSNGSANKSNRKFSQKMGRKGK
jgi:hypothetical protein